ncbi:MAG: bifunctional heptose 7-phosphate kinase/heptose 1-phosphate adenyltransferase, partial [Streptosporangiaceae bacterium]|nr:bifunctional heptose 7-phosphate kinase/heptose 1-phosphate adenyltransferase [Streptosporangiaceae bacterium]
LAATAGSAGSAGSGGSAGEVVLIAPIGSDPASASLLAALPDSVSVIRLPLSGPLQEKTRIRSSGQTLVRVDRPAGVPEPVTRAGGAAGAAGAAAVDAIGSAGAVLVSDYGHGTAADPVLRDALRSTRAPLVWDPHPRGAEPVPGTIVATPNSAEAAAWAGVSGGRGGGAGAGAVLDATAAADRLLDAWPVPAVAVTLGARGALLARSGQAPLAIPALAVRTSDPCGAGDRFAVATAAGLRDGATVPEAVTEAVAAASSFLASGGVAGLEDGGAAALEDDPPADAVAAVRASGGVLVAAGGCFDVLHAGHVAMLRAARSLGDCLVVCMNSDASVRRLKGPGRPFNTQADRVAVLTALDCVDQVMVFDESTPERLLAGLRPAIWVKGGDYDGRDVPEAAVLRRCGGRLVTVPYLAGRSTTRIATAALNWPGPPAPARLG